MGMNESRNRNAIDLDAEACERLSSAIITQAADDYRKALAKLQKRISDPKKKRENDLKARNRIVECESFFRSDWYRTLTDVDGEALIKQLRALVEEGCS